jgi:molecular chaperone DnaK (HSP70)
VKIDQIVHDIVQEIQSQLKEKLNKTANEVVVTIPMIYTSTQKEEFQKCLKKSEFQEIKLVDSTSLLAAACLKSVQQEQIILVGNWTSTHLELAVSKVGGETVEILDKAGSIALGSKSIRRRLTRVLANKLSNEENRKEESVSDEEYEKLYPLLNNAIVELVSKEEITITNPATGKQVTIKRKDVPEIEQVIELLGETIKTNPGIQGVCLKGEGFENNEFVQNIKNQNNMDNASEIVVNQTEINSAAEQLNNGNITKIDRLFLSIGTGLVDDKISPLFPRGTQFPAVCQKFFQTVCDGQSGMNLPFCEGERIRFSKNSQLGSFSIEVPQRFAGQVFIHCFFNLDENGILNVETNIVGENTASEKKQIQLERKTQNENFDQEAILDNLKYLKEDTEALVFEEAKGGFQRGLHNAFCRLISGMNCEKISPDNRQILIRSLIPDVEFLNNPPADATVADYASRLDELIKRLPSGFLN